MKINDHPIGKIFIWICLAVVCGVLIWLSLFWSFAQTADFVHTIQPGIAWPLGAFIQFGPQAFLALRSHTNKATEKVKGAGAAKKKKEFANRALMWLFAFWVLTILDAGTNIGAYFSEAGIETWAEMWMGAQALRTFVMIVVSIGITMVEEILAFIVSVLFHKAAEILEDFGGHPPKSMFLVAERVRSSSGL